MNQPIGPCRQCDNYCEDGCRIDMSLAVADPSQDPRCPSFKARSLAVYKLGDCGDFDWIIAHGPDDAVDLWAETMGEDPADYGYDRDEMVVQVPDNEMLRVDLDHDGEFCEQTCSQWIAEFGRHHLASTNW